MMDVPSRPSTGADLTTASMVSFDLQDSREVQHARAGRNVSQRLVHEVTSPVTPGETKGLIE